MNRQLVRFVILPGLLAATSCAQHSPIGPPTPPPHQSGDNAFISQPPGGGASRQFGGAPGTTASPGTDTNGGGTAPSRSIVEADIYKVVGNTLFVLNTYRGLQVIDITNLNAPKLLTRVPVVGTPIDLYVMNGTAYVAVSDYFWWGWYGGGIDVAGAMVAPSRGSQVWAIDVSTPASPTVLGQLPIDGDLDQTRIVGNVLYVESRHWAYWEWDPSGNGQNQDLTYIASFDISNPKAMKAVDRVDFPATGWQTHANITVDRITLAQSGWDQSGAISNFQVIDISDPAGKLKLGTSFSLPGTVEDRWSMDFDETSGLFRVITDASGWNQGAALDVFSTPTPSAATPLGHLGLNIQESLTTAAFDANRAYLVTVNCTDPLWVVDTTNPAAPVLDGSVAISGALDFVEPMGNTLLALGHDSDTCHAAQGGLNVSLFDVTNPATPKLTSQVSFGQGYNYIDAKKDDYKKVFQVISSIGLILVPYSSWDYTNWTYQGGTQLIDYTSAGLVLRGFASHAGSITRAFPVSNMLVALSDQSLQVLDASNRDQPAQVAAIDLARPVQTLVVTNGYTVELSGDWQRGDTNLSVTPANDPETATPIATVHIPAPNSQMFQNGNVLWILAHDWSNTTETAWLQAVDVTDPTNPVQRGRLDLNPQLVPYWYGYWYWGYGDEAALVGNALALHRMYWGYDYGCPSCVQPQDNVTVIDLSNPDKPQVASTVTLNGSDWSWGLQAVGNFAWITHYEWVPNSSYGYVRYYVDRIDLSHPSSPVLLPKVNVPGVFFSASTDGNTIYTQEIVWSQNWQNVTTYLHELALFPDDTAQLVASTSVPGYAGGAGVNGNFAYLQTSTWSGNNSTTTLAAIDLANMTVTSNQNVGSQWAWLMKATGGKLFLSAGWGDYGILVYDLSTASKPQYQGFVRTAGYVEDVVVSGQTAYLPSGYYGVPMVDLSPGAPLPSF